MRHAERQANAATLARLGAWGAELEAAGRPLMELRTQFSTEQERARGGRPVAKGRSRMKNRVRRRSPSNHMTVTMAMEIERADAIRWIRAQMLEYGLTMEELEAAGCFAPPPSPRPVCYSNAEGLSWDGTGEMPDWLRRAVNAGQTVEFFRVR